MSSNPDYLPGILMNAVNSEGISSRLDINLQGYVDAFRAKDTASYDAISQSLTDSIAAFYGPELWQDYLLKPALQKAVNEGRLTDDDVQTILDSPVSTFMKDNFVEIVKNTMDEAILRHYDDPSAPAQISLNVDIKLNAADGVDLTLTDTGRGFPDGFLRKISDPETRMEHVTHKTASASGKAGMSASELPKLFGGMGMGLRRLIAEVDTGNTLDGSILHPKYEKVDASLAFRNSSEGGAVIQITTPLKPLVRIQEPGASGKFSSGPDGEFSSDSPSSSVYSSTSGLDEDEEPLMQAPPVFKFRAKTVVSTPPTMDSAFNASDEEPLMQAPPAFKFRAKPVVAAPPPTTDSASKVASFKAKLGTLGDPLGSTDEENTVDQEDEVDDGLSPH